MNGISRVEAVVDGVSCRQFSQDWFVAPVTALSVTHVNPAGVDEFDVNRR
jgi:hypothetical protein